MKKPKTESPSRKPKSEPAPSVTVELAASPEAAEAFAEALGALAAELWLDGKFKIR